jgi:RNA-directed DNA polymerase
VYLHLLDRNFRSRVQRGDLHGRLVRYADDFVVLTPWRPDRELAWIHRVMARLGLTLHAEKTRVLDARRDDFVFLGHTHRWRAPRLYLDVAPKAHRRSRDELRRKTRRTGVSLPQVIAELNPYIRGARQYFGRVRRRTLNKLDHFVEQRIARWHVRKYARPSAAWSLVSRADFRRTHGRLQWNLPVALRPADSRPAR